MLLELHILQNFSPSNLNRDDTGNPKECEFGGYRRARISSQCLKRAIRRSFQEDKLLKPEELAVRTKRLLGVLTEQLTSHNGGRDEQLVRKVAETALTALGIGLKEEKTEYLLFLGQQEIDSLVNACNDKWNEMVEFVPADDEKDEKKKKKAKKKALPDEVRAAFKSVLDGGKAADLALFGRMLADAPERNIDAAAQVAHALSTHRISAEFDYYTAVDDLKPEDTAGADMLGTIPFNSACYYRYSSVCLKQLAENLQDGELVNKAAEAFVRASVSSVPTGKQNSMAAHNPPSLVLLCLRESGQWNLANAFAKPVQPMGSQDLIASSVAALDDYFGRLQEMYGDGTIQKCWVATTEAGALKNLKGAKATTVAEIYEGLTAGLRNGSGRE